MTSKLCSQLSPLSALALMATNLSISCNTVAEPEVVAETCMALDRCNALQGTSEQCQNDIRARIDTLIESEALDYMRLSWTCSRLSTCSAITDCFDRVTARYTPIPGDVARKTCERLVTCAVLEETSQAQCESDNVLAMAGLLPEDEKDYILQANTCADLNSCEASTACLDRITPSCDPLYDSDSTTAAANVCDRLFMCGIFQDYDACLDEELAYFDTLCPAQAQEHRLRVNTCAAITDCQSFLDCTAVNFPF